MAERSEPRGNPVHLLLLGRPGAGKTTLRNTILYGCSVGHPGPNAGTIEFDNSPDAVNTINGVPYIVHDTPGLDFNSDASFIKNEFDGNLLNEHCIVVLCIKWNDRLLDADKKVFEIVDSFSNDIWNKVIIALTHSDVLPHNCTEKNKIEKLNAEWHEATKVNIRKFGVPDDTLEQLNICNTSIIGKNCFFQHWLRTFIMKLAGTLSVNVCRHIVSSCIVPSEFVSAVSAVSAVSGASIGAFGGILTFIGCVLGGVVLGVIFVAAYIKLNQC